jgi:transposase-like protein
MTLLRNERTRFSVEFNMHFTECFCPFCRHWTTVWGGGSTYRGRRICAYCTWHRNKMAAAWREKD